MEGGRGGGGGRGEVERGEGEVEGGGFGENISGSCTKKVIVIFIKLHCSIKVWFMATYPLSGSLNASFAYQNIF